MFHIFNILLIKIVKIIKKIVQSVFILSALVAGVKVLNQKAVKPKVKKPGKDLEKKAVDKFSALGARQLKIFKLIKTSKEVDMSDLEGKFKSVTRRTLRRDLQKLIDIGLVEKHGKTKAAKYTLA